ncbi:SRPBCC domain-containing protein [Neobacillus piezotolerans]|uniref:SRPBCC domain-containing protein n=1 Tax=Neobacillus piezotolerans TaxID=2259171 RepID=A0A3D8GUT7_9BACI|nr:SRPBCC domain-containing protein [Neobacillus piezotolerans]RDU37921.1 SRPBCC domain-containing protein [Neobacillus piezotolerans]
MSENKALNAVASRVEGLELIIERVFDAPRELVFSVFSDPVHLAAWWGPKGWETEVPELDFNEDGVWLYCMTCVDKNQGDFFGMKSCAKAVYHEIVVPEKIVYTDFFTDTEYNVLPEMPEMVITMEFIEEEGKTKIISRSKFSTAEAVKKVVDMGAVQGVSSQYERLDDYLSELQSK